MTLATLELEGRSFALRRAKRQDIAPIVQLMANDAIRQADFPEDHETSAGYEQAFAAIDSDPAHLLIVVEDEVQRIVGTMQLTLLPGLARAGATRLQIEAVRVDERLRGNGVGSEMIRWAISEGERRGARLIQLTSDASRKSAHRFYERLGFTASHVGFKFKLNRE